ncbi:protein-serine/threonine phosphatase [Malassezia sp. CBS 17886]|nr:protein-serine/threonine phosphatase [Malassezia sp. CBS 17886]
MTTPEKCGPEDDGDGAHTSARDDAGRGSEHAAPTAPPRALPTLEALVRRPKRCASSEAGTAVARPLVSAAPAVPRGTSGVIQQTPKVLVLDLDETLIHSKLRPAPLWGILSPPYHTAAGDAERAGARSSNRLLSFLGLSTRRGLMSADTRLQPTVIEVNIDGRKVYYQVYKRPWVDYFLRKVASWYQVVVFTASMKEYADPVIDWLDGGQGLISGRLFRESCILRNGSYLKDLAVVERDLSRVCLVDNSPISYELQESNGIPVEGWTHDPRDEALLDLLPILDGLRFASDVRHILGLRGF